MQTHLHLHGLPSPPNLTTKAPPWMANRPPTPTTLPLSNKNYTKLCSQGRGFGAALPDKKQKNQNQNQKRESESEDGDDDEIPQEVFDRILRRVISYVTFPMGAGVGLLFVLGWVKEKWAWDVPGWLPLLTALLAFGTSAVGIAYGTLSTSWDPEREGSLLGWDEVVKNWPEIMKERDDDEDDDKRNR